MKPTLSGLSKVEMEEKQRIRARHETVNRRFKTWGILKNQYHHNIQEHELVFRAVVVMVQLSIDNGNCLFGCETETTKI